MASIGILYICTGKYSLFWKDFYETAERFFLIDGHQVQYFVFTDSESLHMQHDARVKKIYQPQLPWPLTTLHRFKIFQSAQRHFEEIDTLYFFNANMIFVDYVGDEILPEKGKPLVFLRHPLMYFKKPEEFTYDRNPESLAYIAYDQGKHYFMGALNGGEKNAYLNMVDELQERIAEDEQRGITALWHDESHLNWYALNNHEKIKSLDPSYGYPEDRKLPFSKKIVIRDKNKLGGHAYLRGLDEKGSLYTRLLHMILRQK